MSIQAVWRKLIVKANMEDVFHYYNKNQNKWKVNESAGIRKSIYGDSMYDVWTLDIVSNRARGLHEWRTVTFYEWLFNPKYRVFDTLRLQYEDIADRGEGSLKPYGPERLMRFLQETVEKKARSLLRLPEVSTTDDRVRNVRMLDQRTRKRTGAAHMEERKTAFIQ